MFGSNILNSKVLAVAFAVGILSTSALAAPSASRGPQMPESAPGTQSAMTFQGWKSLRVEEAKLVLERLTFENQVDRAPIVDRSPGERQAVVKSAPEAVVRASVGARAGKSVSRSDSRIEQARINLEIAQDLSMNDYLQIYLSQVKSRDALLDVARRMAPEDVVDLLVSYQKLSSGGQIAEHSAIGNPRLPPRPL